jgi:hypothetical protein
MYCVSPPPCITNINLPYYSSILCVGYMGVMYTCTRYIVLYVNKVVDKTGSMCYNTMGNNPTDCN